MSGNEPTPRWRGVLLRYGGSAGLLLAVLLFLTLPAAGVSCHRNSPFAVCYTGRQIVTADPGVRVPDVLPGRPKEAAKLRNYVADTAPLSGGTRILTVIATAVLIAGMLSAALRRPGLRAVVVAAGAVTGAGLLMATEITAIGRLTDDVRGKTRLFPSYYGEVPGAHDIVETGLGFWLPLAALVAVAAFGAGSWMYAWFSARNAEYEDRSDGQAADATCQPRDSCR